MITLYLLRHGNTFESGETPLYVGRGSDLLLTEAGRAQARAFADQMKVEGVSFDAIYSSALKRQRETAEIIATELDEKKRLRVADDSLAEIHYGAWEGKSNEEIEGSWSTQFADWREAGVWPEAVFEDAESERVSALKSWLQSVRDEFHDDATLLAVSSNGLMRQFHRFVADSWSEHCQQRRLEELKVRTGAYGILELFSDSVNVRVWNERPS